MMTLAYTGIASGTQDIESRVDAIFEQWNKPGSPGCALGVYRDGQLIYARGYGMANLELEAKITPQSIFDIGSTSKQFTAFSIMLLAKNGKLSLDDDIRKYIPEIPGYGKTVTIRNMLHHTSGIRDYCELLAYSGFHEEDLTTENDALQVLSRQKALNFQPGNEFVYSNSGYFLLSVIVKRVSGQPLRDFARENIFKPLGMNHTQYNDRHTRIIPNRAAGYSPEPDGFGISMSDWEQVGDGAVLTSVEDLLLWDRNFYDYKVGGPEVIAWMLTTGKLNNNEPLNYASGLFIGEYRGLKTVSHGGAWAGYRAELLRFPDQKFSVACLCNLGSMNPSFLAMKVADVYLGELMKPESTVQAADSAPGIEVPAAELEQRVGAYRNSKNGAIYRIALEGGKLMANASGMQFKLIPTAPGTYKVEGAPITITFAASPAGVRSQMQVMVANEKEPRILDPIDLWTPAPAQLTEMAGNYKSEELGIVVILVYKDGTLLLKHRAFAEEPIPLTPTLKDNFMLGNLSITFTRIPGGQIDGFSLDSGRMKNIGFTKQ